LAAWTPAAGLIPDAENAGTSLLDQAAGQGFAAALQLLLALVPASTFGAG
jgi:hypothetical protein